MTIVELVDELESIAERFWSADEAEAAAIMRTADVCAVLELVYGYAVAAHPVEEIDKLAALEADRAEKARRLIGLGSGTAQGINGHVSDGDAAELAAQGKAFFDRYQTIVLGRVLALEIGKFALDLFKPTFEDGLIGFKRIDALAAQKQAEALKWLATRVEELECGNCGMDVHDVIIAYRDGAGRYKDFESRISGGGRGSVISPLPPAGLNDERRA